MNNHGIRTEHGRSPHQIFTESALQLHNSESTATLDLFDGVGMGESDFTSEEDHDAEYPNDTEGIIIPITNLNMTEEQITQLREVNPLHVSE